MEELERTKSMSDTASQMAVGVKTAKTTVQSMIITGLIAGIVCFGVGVSYGQKSLKDVQSIINGLNASAVQQSPATTTTLPDEEPASGK